MARRKNRVTMEDVARAAGVSAMTVSRVLNKKGEIHEETRQRILKIMDEMDYRPSRVARSLATSRTFTLGVMVPDISNPFYSELVFGAETVAWDNGYHMLLCHTKDDEEREEAVLRLLEETQVDGVLVCSARLPDDDLLALLNKQRAVVMLNRQIPNLDAGILHVEDVSGAIQAVNHLIDSGRKRIGHIAGPAHTWSAQARRQGFIQANEQAGLSRNVNLIASCKPNSASGQEATLKLLTTYPDIDSLFCYNDLVAIGALQACQQLGKRIPEDIALVGSDDIPLASLISPALTTLHVDKAELGALLLRLLIERVEGQVEQEEILIQQELIIRDSAP